MLLTRVLLAAVVGTAGDSEWPHFRGPRADGHAAGPIPAAEWNDTKNVVWRAAVPGLGWSSPAIVGDRVFLTTAVPDDEALSLRALALDAATGRTIWDREVFAIEKAPRIHPTSPLLVGDDLFFVSDRGIASCVNAKTGETHWSERLGGN